MRTVKAKKQAAEMSDQKLGEESCRAMDVLSLAIAKGRDMGKQISLIELLTSQVEKMNTKKQAVVLSKQGPSSESANRLSAVAVEFGPTVDEIKKDLIAELDTILDGYTPGIQRLALIAMLGRFDIRGVDNDVFMDEFARRLGGLPLNARKEFHKIFTSPAVTRRKKHKLAG